MFVTAVCPTAKCVIPIISLLSEYAYSLIIPEYICSPSNGITYSDDIIPFITGKGNG